MQSKKLIVFFVPDKFAISRQRVKKFAPLFRSWFGGFPVVHLLKPEHVEVKEINLNLGFILILYLLLFFRLLWAVRLILPKDQCTSS